MTIIERGQFTANDTLDGVTVSGATHISLNGGFGGGTIAVQNQTNGTFYPMLTAGAAITATAADDFMVNTANGDIIRLVLTGSTTPTLDWQISSRPGR